MSSTSAPTSGTGTGGTGNIKYRAACDHCSATKIKCTQERPSCARCRALGRDCHYSRSLRAGKPPRSSQGLNRRISHTPVLPRHDPPVEIARPSNSPTSYHGLAYGPLSPAKQDPTWMSSTGPYPTPPAIAPNGNGDVSFFPDLHAPEHHCSTSPLDPEWFFDFNNGADLLSDMNTPSLDSKATSQHSSPTSDTKHSPFQHVEFAPGFDDPNGMGPFGASSDKCIKIATDTLSKLYDMPMIQIDANTRQPSTDQVLNSTSRAIQICHDLISCTGPMDFYLPILIATIGSKILAWYQAVALIRDPHIEIPGGKRCCAKEVVMNGQMGMGGYKTDDKMDWMLKNHVVLGQLQRLSDVVNRYHSQFCNEGAPGESGRLYATFGSFLKSRLHFTLQEVETRLRTPAGNQ